jgi:hypothetical protein
MGFRAGYLLSNVHPSQTFAGCVLSLWPCHKLCTASTADSTPDESSISSRSVATSDDRCSRSRLVVICLLQILERVRRRYRLVVLGYVVMPEHVHLLVSESQRATLSTAIQALKLGVVRSLQGGGVPTSRKGSEKWEHPPVLIAPKKRITFGRRDSMTSTFGPTFGPRRSELRSCATFSAIPWCGD